MTYVVQTSEGLQRHTESYVFIVSERFFCILQLIGDNNWFQFLSRGRCSIVETLCTLFSTVMEQLNEDAVPERPRRACAQKVKRKLPATFDAVPEEPEMEPPTKKKRRTRLSNLSDAEKLEHIRLGNCERSAKHRKKVAEELERLREELATRPLYGPCRHCGLAVNPEEEDDNGDDAPVANRRLAILLYFLFNLL